MILLSHPFSDEVGDEPLVLHAEVERDGIRIAARAITVHVQRGGMRLTGGDGGHKLRFQLGFWEITEPAPVTAFQGSKRINALDDMVVAGLLWDLRRHKRGYDIPREDLLSALSRDSMKRLDLMVEVMGS